MWINQSEFRSGFVSGNWPNCLLLVISLSWVQQLVTLILLAMLCHLNRSFVRYDWIQIYFSGMDRVVKLDKMFCRMWWDWTEISYKKLFWSRNRIQMVSLRSLVSWYRLRWLFDFWLDQNEPIGNRYFRSYYSGLSWRIDFRILASRKMWCMS